MEKPGSIGGCGYRRRLLGILAGSALLLVTPGALYGDWGSGEDLSVILQSGAGELKVGESWSLSLLIDHPNPSEVTVLQPELPAHLRLDKVSTAVTVVSAPSGREERWTEVQFFYTPILAGHFVLGSFEVSTPETMAATAPQSLSAGPSVDHTFPYQPTLRWLDLPQKALPVGGADILLAVEGGDPGVDYASLAARAVLFVPENTLAEVRPLLREDVQRGGILRIRLIPLMGPRIALPSLTLNVSGRTLISPSGFLSVVATPGITDTASQIRASMGEQRGASDQTAVRESTVPQTGPSWPETVRVPWIVGLPFLSEGYRASLRAARVKWDLGSYGAAVASLRAAERDTVWGPALRPLRAGLETSLGHQPGPDEPLSPTLPLLAASAIFAGAGLLLGKSKTARLLFITLAAGTAIYLGAVRLDALGYFGRGRGAILMECDAFKVPDTSSVPVARFLQGQYVRIRTLSGDWAFAEAPDGTAGWIVGASAIRY